MVHLDSVLASNVFSFFVFYNDNHKMSLLKPEKKAKYALIC